MKEIKSLGIDRAVQIAIGAGNSIKEISEGLSDVQQVVCMENGLTAAVRNDIQRHVPTLQCWSTDRTPHNPAEEGFICNTYKVGLSFPRD